MRACPPTRRHLALLQLQRDDAVASLNAERGALRPELAHLAAAVHTLVRVAVVYLLCPARNTHGSRARVRVGGIRDTDAYVSRLQCHVSFVL